MTVIGPEFDGRIRDPYVDTDQKLSMDLLHGKYSPGHFPTAVVHTAHPSSRADLRRVPALLALPVQVMNAPLE